MKIGGTIIAVGGGELPDGIEELIRRTVEKDESRLLTLRFQDSDSANPNLDLLGNLDSEVTVNEINVDDGASAPTEASRREIRDATVLAISADRLTQSNIDYLESIFADLKGMIDDGGIILASGSTISLLGKLRNEQFENLTANTPAANLIPDTILIPNYNDQRDRPALLAQLATYPRMVGIGIEPETAIVLRERKIRVVGKGSATFLLMANETKPLRVQRVKQAVSRRANPYETIIDLTAWRRDAIERTLKPFPAENPRVPVVENGTLLIVGGGGMPSGLMEQMVELAGGKEARMVYVPCTEADEVSPDQRTVAAWKQMGVASAVTLHTKDRHRANTDEEFLEPLKAATGIWFGGGRQWNFADSYYGTEAHRLMKEVLDRGGVIGGSSAGASIQGRYMCRANPVANFDIMAPGYERGLGFLDGVAIDQHFSQRGRQKDMTQLANRYPQLLGIGLDEATAIIVRKSEAQVVGRGKVFFYDRINQPVIPGEDDYIAPGVGPRV